MPSIQGGQTECEKPVQIRPDRGDSWRAVSNVAERFLQDVESPSFNFRLRAFAHLRECILTSSPAEYNEVA